MHKSLIQRSRLALATAAALLIGTSAFAQTWPAKPIRLIVPFPAGGAVDTVARTLGQKASETWKQPVIVDNKPGAGGNIGAEALAKSPADGHTIMMTTQGLSIAPSIYRKLPFDIQKDMQPVTQLTSSYLVLTVGPALSVTTLPELIALAKARPGALNYASTGVGSAPHLSMELLKSAAGIDLLHVPYKGDGPLNQAMMAGDVGAGFSPLSGVIAPAKAGKLRMIAITAPRRSATLPDVPAVAESVAGFDHTGWLGVFAPGGTPIAVLRAIQTELARGINLPEIKEKLPVWGYEGVGSTPEAFSIKFRNDIAAYAKAVQDAKLPLQD
jgi:tripartite-type tricarboxylate transporter receptor subunit TctC